MNRIEKRKGKLGKPVGMILLVMLMFYGTSYDSTVYSVEGAVEKVLAPEVYYHLDMGVQLVSYNGLIWDDGFEYGVSSRSDISTSIQFNQEIKVNEVYPLESVEGIQRYDFSGLTSSDNIPSGLGSGQDAYNYYYKDYVSSLMDVNTWGGAGNTASFTYDAFLGTVKTLEVMEYGELGRGEYIYSLFGGEAQLQSSQPEIYDSITQALEQGASGTAGNRKLFLVFCPNVIEYQKFIEVADLMADLALPVSAKQGETYTVEDISLIDDELTVERAALEKCVVSGASQLGLTGTDWETVASWVGSLPGENTGGVLVEQAGESGTVNYRLTVTADNGQVDQVIKTLQIVDGRDIQGTAKLNLQPVTYEGHPAWAVDESTFIVEGQSYSGTRAYEEEAATNRFIPQSGSGGETTRENLTQAKVLFPVRGLYNVKLEVILADTSVLEDTKPIEVRKTPFISASLGGVQKQNRRQVITAVVATYPGKPITDYRVEVMDMVTGERITLTKEEPQINNGVIKTRSINVSGGAEQLDPEENDAYWTTFTLEFLTKSPAWVLGEENLGQEFKYKIWVLDSKGDTDLVEKKFRVVPDIPPNPVIQIQDTFLREEGTNEANIEMEDGTTTDGDQIERAWFVDGMPMEDMPGFQDLSFGSKLNVQFEKQGVGPVEIQLKVQEKWIEATLEEYVTQEDRKTGETTKTTEVINIAPVISLKAVPGKEANVNIITSEGQSQLFENQLNSMKARFLENGVFPQINIIKRPQEDSGGYRQVYHKSWDSAMWCALTCREIGPIYDSNYVYTILSNSIIAQNYSQICNGTHTIYAESVDGTLPDWNYTVNQAASFFVKLDNKGKYVYVIFRDLERTILLNRETGAEVGTIPVSLNGEIFLNQKNEIFVVNSSQIGKYNPGTQILEKVSPGGSLSRMMEGKIGFVGKDLSSRKGNRFYCGLYDMEKGVLTGRALPEISAEGINWTAGNKSDITPVDVDLDGKVIFMQTYNNNYRHTGQNTSVWIADSKNQEVKCAPLITPISSEIYYLSGLSVGFVTDSTGAGKYIYLSYYEDQNRTTTTVRWYFKLFDMKLGTQLPVTEVMATGRQTNNYNFSGISYAKIHESENKIYVLRGNAFQGSDWGGIQTGERMTINLPSLTRGEVVAQWDVADEYGTDNGFLSATYYFYEQWINPENRVKVFKNTITQAQAIERAIKQNVSQRNDETTYVLSQLIPVKLEIEAAIDAICVQVQEKAKVNRGLKLENGEGITRGVPIKEGGQYSFEYEVLTTPGGISKLFYPVAYLEGDPPQTGMPHYKNVAAFLDFTNSTSISNNTFYAYTSTTYLEGRGGYGSGYYGESGQSRSYNFTVTQTMGKPGYTEFDLFSYFGDQAYGSWAISVDGRLYDAGSGPVDSHKTVFLEAGEHWITVSGNISSGYSGYVGIGNIQTVYYDYAGASNFKERISRGDIWNSGNGSFNSPPELLFNKSVETKDNILRENFYGNTVNLSQYIRFYDNGICLWGYSGNGAFASMGSTYSTSATGSFGVDAPLDKHLIVSYDETTYVERTPTATYLTGNSKMIGEKVFFVAAGQSFYRNYYLQRGRSGGYGSVRIENIRVIEIPATIPGDSVFGDSGTFPINISQRTTPFYSVKFLAPASEFYQWTAFTGLDGKNPSEGSTISLVPKAMAEARLSLVKKFKLYETIENAKFLVLEQSFQNGEEIAADKWNMLLPGEVIEVATVEEQEEKPPSMVYKKGQLVAFDIGYNDYENDPSRRQYWTYYHTPMNDGPHPGASQLGPDGTAGAPGPVFGAPIERFYIDGKYIVEHWQEDNTARTAIPLDGNGYPAGNSNYDKLSNVETITFYVEGTSEAPWIKSIETGASQLGPGGTPIGFTPLIVKEGDDFALQIEVDDLEKDILNLKTEVYKDGKFIYQHYKEGIQAVEGNYPAVVTGKVGMAFAGKYQVICTVRDEIGAGLGSYMFTVSAEGKIIGSVSHTAAWEANRKNYNLKHEVIGDEETPRGKNTFWPGEVFVLEAEVAGAPSVVKAEILGYTDSLGAPEHKTIMATDGEKNAKGELVYKGEIWKSSMINHWAKKGPLLVTFRFTAIYGASQLGPGGTVIPAEGSKVIYHDVQIIIDDRDSYLMLHRVW